MTSRIPPSLKWLVRKRKEIYGEILSLQNEALNLFLKNHTLIKKLRKNLKAIDDTIKLHEIIINPEKIRPIQKYEKSSSFKHGELTSLIYECLSQKENFGKTTIQIAEYITIKKGLDESEYIKLKETVRYRLKNLYIQHKVEKLSKGKERMWFLLGQLK